MKRFTAATHDPFYDLFHDEQHRVIRSWLVACDIPSEVFRRERALEGFSVAEEPFPAGATTFFNFLFHHEVRDVGATHAFRTEEEIRALLAIQIATRLLPPDTLNRVEAFLLDPEQPLFLKDSVCELSLSRCQLPPVPISY